MGFFGTKAVKYPDESIHLHVECLGEQKDSYVPEKDDATIKSTTKVHIPSSPGHATGAGGIPVNMTVGGRGGGDDRAETMSLGSDASKSVFSVTSKARSTRSNKRQKEAS